MQTTYRILSLDGGGIRGLLSAVLLQRLEDAVPGWLRRTRLLAGTSTGGIMALGLAAGVPTATIRELYEQRGAVIFDDSWLDNIKDIGSLVGARYDNRKLAIELRRLFGRATLRDLRKHVLVPAFDLDNAHPDPEQRCWQPKFFHNFAGADSDGGRPVWKVALYTSAAPTYFPSVDGYIDGGVVANNPSVAALAQTQDRRAMRRPPSLDRIALLSIGTGQSMVHIPGQRLDWGTSQWAAPLLNILFDGGMGLADYQCRQMLGKRYLRLAPAFAPGHVIALDAVERVRELVEVAESVDLTAAVEWIRRVWMAPKPRKRVGAPITAARKLR
jgi:hypothetical protein